MKKLLDKLMHVDKKILLFLFIICIIGLITGALFMTILNSTDKTMITDSLNKYMTFEANKDYITLLTNNLIVNLMYILAIWILGISMIGLPIVVGIIFFKSFILSFSLSTFIANYKLKGVLLGFIYNFPHNIINLFIYIYLGVYSIKLSSTLINAVIHKKNIDFRNIMNRYLLVLLVAFLLVVITTLIETFVTPIFLQKISNML